ncbi:Peroxisome biogenesis protein 1 [Apostasia shenzhenica]|uniref:Peroxisome biogenesis protein 1 n=1 Tax=Apostasia shenzhenica TaxID=1088818 RepID=A0A2H9ZW12_9ASPA|nr:Peroxisome biogenesis protein 1 [Apostasia shenzhenica]
MLRVQDSNKKYVHRFDFKGFELGVVLTSVAFVHPETAKKLSFDSLQLVVVEPRLPSIEIMNYVKDTAQRRGGNSATIEDSTERSTSKTGGARYVVLRIIYSEIVAKGHVILHRSTRLFIRAGKSDGIGSDGQDSLEKYKNSKLNSTSSGTGSLVSANVTDLEQYEKFLEFLLDKVNLDGDKENASKHGTSLDKKFLIQSWFIGQLKEIASITKQMGITSIILAKETLLHFEITNGDFGSKSVESLPCDSHVEEHLGQSTFEFLYLLVATFDDSSHASIKYCYQLSTSAENKDIYEFDLGSISRRIEFGDPVFLDSFVEGGFNRKLNWTLSSLSWMEKVTSAVINSRHLIQSHMYDLFLFIYEKGSGKSTLMMAVAKYLEEHEEVLAHVGGETLNCRLFVNCSKLALEKSQTIRQTVMNHVSEALMHSPSLIIFDDLDNIIPFASDSEGSQPSASVAAIANFFVDVIDEYREKSQISCGYGCIAFMASAQSLGKLPQLLTSSGRFDFHVELLAPAVCERGAILKQEIQNRGLLCSGDIISEIASKCDGYDAYDLIDVPKFDDFVLVASVDLWSNHHLSKLNPMKRFFPLYESLGNMMNILVDRAVHAAASHSLAYNDKENKIPNLVAEDFSKAMHDFVPVAMRGLTKAGAEGGRVGWDDVGGLTHVRIAIQEMVELPSKFPNIFAKSPLRMRSNMLLYGPPGCGKTHIIAAAAAACSLRFISVKGPELLNKYIGASEQAVRDLFSKAAAASPCLLFFDEFDSIAPKRGHDNTGVTDRVVNQVYRIASYFSYSYGHSIYEIEAYWLFTNLRVVLNLFAQL